MATTEFPHHAPESSLRAFVSLVEAGAGRLAAVWRAAKNRRAVNQLLSWDSRMLNDIGLTEGDVRSALASRFGDDPSDRLGAFSAERRASRGRGPFPHEWPVDI